MGDTDMADLEVDFFEMDIESPEDAFIDNIAQLWTCVSQITSYETDLQTSFDTFMLNVPEDRWLNCQWRAYTLFKETLCGSQALKENNIIRRINILFSRIQDAMNTRSSQQTFEEDKLSEVEQPIKRMQIVFNKGAFDEVKILFAQTVRKTTAFALYGMHARKRKRRGPDDTPGAKADTRRGEFNNAMHWHAINRIVDILL